MTRYHEREYMMTSHGFGQRLSRLVVSQSEKIKELQAEIERLRTLLDRAKWQLNQPEHGQKCNCRDLAQDGRYCNRHTIANTIQGILDQ